MTWSNLIRLTILYLQPCYHQNIIKIKTSNNEGRHHPFLLTCLVRFLERLWCCSPQGQHQKSLLCCSNYSRLEVFLLLGLLLDWCSRHRWRRSLWLGPKVRICLIWMMRLSFEIRYFHLAIFIFSFILLYWKNRMIWQSINENPSKQLFSFRISWKWLGYLIFENVRIKIVFWFWFNNKHYLFSRKFF